MPLSPSLHLTFSVARVKKNPKCHSEMEFTLQLTRIYINHVFAILYCRVWIAIVKF